MLNIVVLNYMVRGKICLFAFIPDFMSIADNSVSSVKKERIMLKKMKI